MIDALTACGRSPVYLKAFHHKEARGIDTIDITFNKKRREEYIEKVFENLLSHLSFVCMGTVLNKKNCRANDPLHYVLRFV
jgi:2-keto-3-deoxy-6-phosphogluconate aldolase